MADDDLRNLRRNPKFQQLADKIGKSSPMYLPTQLGVLSEIRAAAILSRDPRKAVDILAVATPYEY